VRTPTSEEPPCSQNVHPGQTSSPSVDVFYGKPLMQCGVRTAKFVSICTLRTIMLSITKKHVPWFTYQKHSKHATRQLLLKYGTLTPVYFLFSFSDQNTPYKRMQNRPTCKRAEQILI